MGLIRELDLLDEDEEEGNEEVEEERDEEKDSEKEVEASLNQNDSEDEVMEMKPAQTGLTSSFIKSHGLKWKGAAFYQEICIYLLSQAYLHAL